jgi:uncharacterized protein involved in tolerance to divalent cations
MHVHLTIDALLLIKVEAASASEHLFEVNKYHSYGTPDFQALQRCALGIGESKPRQLQA